MKQKRLTYQLYSSIIALILAACQPDEIIPLESFPRVPDEVQVYVDRFSEEAAARGIELDMSKLEVSLNSSILPAKAAGACHFYAPSSHPQIFIDTSSINWKQGGLTREALVFHELAHCILGRTHRDDLLENGNYASLMRSDKGVLYEENFNAYKRAYYLDELFNPDLQPPEWTVMQREAWQPLTGTLWFEEDFVDNQQNWTLGQSPNSTRAIEFGALKLASHSKGAVFLGKRIPLGPSQDFDATVRLRLVKGNRPVLFQWGDQNGGDLFYFGYGQNQYAIMGHGRESIGVGRTVKAIREHEENTLEVFKRGDQYAFFINGVPIDKVYYPGRKEALWGFYIGSYSEMEVSYFSLKVGS